MISQKGPLIKWYKSGLIILVNLYHFFGDDNLYKVVRGIIPKWPNNSGYWNILIYPESFQVITQV